MLYVNYCLAFHQPDWANEIISSAKRLCAICEKEQNYIDLVEMLYQEEYEKIIEMTQGVNVLDNNHKFIRATALYYCGRNLEARSLFDQMHNIEGAAIAAAKMNDFDGAFAYVEPRLKECEQSNYQTKDSPFIVSLTAQILQQQGKFQEALKLLEKAWALRKSTNILQKIGYSKYMLGQYADAIKIFKMILATTKSKQQFVDVKELLVACLDDYANKTQNENIKSEANRVLELQFE